MYIKKNKVLKMRISLVLLGLYFETAELDFLAETGMVQLLQRHFILLFF